jgi:hypothetical protein
MRHTNRNSFEVDRANMAPEFRARGVKLYGLLAIRTLTHDTALNNQMTIIMERRYQGRV